MHKFKSFINLDKEEAWLSDMSAEGWYFRKRNSLNRYTFTQGEKKRYTYKIDYRDFKSQADYLDYLSLFADSGWIHIAGTRWSGLQYFTPVEAGANKELFSNTADKAGRYKRMSSIWLFTFFAFATLFLVQVFTGWVDLSFILRPAELYYTPGLWDMTGWSFWRAFLFETPFALMRGFAWIIVLLALCLYIYYIIRIWQLGRKAARS